jgi:hypothetical protein
MALSELKIEETSVYKGKEYNIVEFCQDYLGLPLNETINLSNELIDVMPVVYLSEWDVRKAVDNYKSVGDRIRAGIKNRTPYGNPSVNTARGGFGRFAQNVGNTLNTQGAILRSSPIVKVIDPTTGKLQYFAFPELDLGRNGAGHNKILDSIVANLNTGGKRANIVYPGEGDWVAAQKQAVKIDTAPADQNKKAEVLNILKGLNTTVQGHLANATKYSFMSNDELENIRQEIAKAANLASNNITKAEQAPENPAAATNVVNDAVKKVEQAAPTAPAAQTTPTAAPTSPAAATPQAATTEPQNPSTPAPSQGFNVVQTPSQSTLTPTGEAPALPPPPEPAPTPNVTAPVVPDENSEFEVGGENPGTSTSNLLASPITSDELASAASSKLAAPTSAGLAPAPSMATPAELNAPAPAEGETGVALPQAPTSVPDMTASDLEQPKALAPEELSDIPMPPPTSGIDVQPTGTVQNPTSEFNGTNVTPAPEPLSATGFQNPGASNLSGPNTFNTTYDPITKQQILDKARENFKKTNPNNIVQFQPASKTPTTQVSRYKTTPGERGEGPVIDLQNLTKQAR